jgi:uncharacterized protein (TIGR00251 family)
MSSDDWVWPAPDGALLRVWVGPGASRSGVAGLRGAALRVRVKAPPEGGAANRELLRVLAERLGVRPGDVTLEAGGSGREKRVRVRGLDPGAVRARLLPPSSVDTATGRH